MLKSKAEIYDTPCEVTEIALMFPRKLRLILAFTEVIHRKKMGHSVYCTLRTVLHIYSLESCQALLSRGVG